MEGKIRLAVFGQKRLSREGGIEIVVKELCTDSFHGTAFSILNEKQFVVFNRYAENSSFSKNSRIDTLCVNFGLENRRYKNGMSLSDVVKDDIDYKAVGEKYKNLKLVTDEYLDTILREIKGRA